MLNKFKKQMKNEKGLTLIELLAVIVILAIIAAIAVPSIGEIINNSKQKAILGDAANIIAGAKIAAIDGVCNAEATPSTCTNTNIEDYIDKLPKDSTFTVSKDSTDWHIEYSKFSDVKKAPFDNGLDLNKIAEKQLIENMGNK